MCDDLPAEYKFYESDDDNKYKVIYKKVNNRDKVIFWTTSDK